MKRWGKSILIGLGAVVLTTLGISASDTLQGASGSLVGMALKSNQVVGCPPDTVEMVASGRRMCVDVFEASAAESCPHKDPQNLQETEENLGVQSCIPTSRKDAAPWFFINLSQAQRACAAAGKRLLTSEEWYRSALGTPTDESSCNVNNLKNQSARNTVESACKSSVGAYDLIGNVWEWVDESVTDGAYHGRTLPDTGYVAGVDPDGVALTTGQGEDALYGKDYFWKAAAGMKGMVRGGYYGSGSDGGLYALNASIDLGFGSAGIGFRCVREYPE